MLLKYILKYIFKSKNFLLIKYITNKCFSRNIYWLFYCKKLNL